MTVRVVHIFGRMGIGGAETWLMNLYRRLDTKRVRFDFLVHRDEPGEYDDEIRSLGGTITRVGVSYRSPAYGPRLIACMRDHQVVHSHVSFFSGVTLPLAYLAGVPVRIAHSHTATKARPDDWRRRAYEAAMRASVQRTATRGLGCSRKAVASLFGPEWQAAGIARPLYYGLDLARFRRIPSAAAAVKREFSIDESAVLVGQIGRFVTPKNHEFSLELIAESVQQGRNQHYLFVGDGELRSGIETRAAERGLTDRITFAGQRTDVARLLHAMDVMIQPSLWEGFGITAIEAEAAGVPCVASDRVPVEIAEFAPHTQRIPLGDPAAWLAAMDRAMAERGDPDEMLDQLLETPIEIDKHVEAATRMYEQLAATAPASAVRERLGRLPWQRLTRRPHS